MVNGSFQVSYLILWLQENETLIFAPLLSWTLSLLGRSANEDIPKIPDVMDIIINKGVFGGG